MKNKKIERSERIPLQVVIRIPGELDLTVSFCRNLSVGGMFLESFSPSKKGTKIQVELTLPNSKRTLRLSGVVAWTRAVDDGAGSPGMGIKFENMSDSETKELESSIAYLSEIRSKASA